MNKDITKNTFFITGGGTGGHIYPAVSVTDELIKNGADKNKIFYIGNKNNLEYKIAKDNGYNFLSTSVFGMPRKISPKFIKWIFCLFISILKCVLYSLKYKPDVIFATGGYVTAPVLFAARILNIPYVLHDSDCYPGVVTRSFAKKAYGINLAFEEAEKYIKSNNIKHFKNPVRKAFFKTGKNEAREQLNIKDEFLILIMGGSQGAKSINSAATELIKKYGEKENIKIILQTGKKNYDEIVKDFNIPSNTRIEPYFDNMAIPILASDLIVSRAGSISISEILSSKNPSILIPYPYAAADHQRYNAKAIVNKNAALYIEDKDLKENKLIETIENLLSDREKYNALKENASNLGKDYEFSTEKITDLIVSAIK